MDYAALQVYLAVVDEGSFSRASEKLFRTQPAVSLAVKRLEEDLGEQLIDRSSRELKLTDAGQTVLDYARRFENLRHEMLTSLDELRDVSAGLLQIGANESTTVYLLQHLRQFRQLYPKVKVRVRRCRSSQIPDLLLSGELEMGAISYRPVQKRIVSQVIYTDRLCFVCSPQHRLATRKSVSIKELGLETFIAHNVVSPYRQVVLQEFQQHRIPLNMDIELPTVESMRKLIQQNEGVSFLPRMCVDQDIRQGTLCEVQVQELQVKRKIRLVYPRKRVLSRAAKAFLELLKS